MAERYIALVGCNLGADNTRYEPGDEIPKIDRNTAMSWLAEGLIKSADDTPVKKPSKKVEEEDGSPV